MTAIRQTVRYRGDTEEARQAAFRADVPTRAAAGWVVATQGTEYEMGAPGPELVVTYEHPTDFEPPPESQWRPMPAPPSQAGRAAAWKPATAANEPAAWTPQRPARAPVAWAPPRPAPRPEPWDVGGYAATVPVPGRTQQADKDGDETSARLWLRRLMTFGTPVVFVAVALMIPSAQEGRPATADYPALAVESALIGVFTLGIAWYAARWRGLRRILRWLVVSGLVLLAILFGLAALQYASGVGPSAAGPLLTMA